MKWKQFSKFISPEKYSNIHSNRDTISQLVIHRGQVEQVKTTTHKWYPKDVKNNDWVEGYRYVDMNHSYFGSDALILSEASCCVILLLLDSQSNRKFSAHICATSDLKSLNWLRMQFDLKCFFKSINYNLSRAENYFFSNNLYKDGDGSFEQRNVMRLLLSAFTENQLRYIASCSHFIEGENGNRWNPRCAIRLGDENKHQAMNISFAH